MNKRMIAGVIAVAASGFLLWQYLTPVEIVAVHENDTMLVRHFPYLKSRQIAWWEENKAMIQTKYGIPSKSIDGYYNVYIQDYGDGYRKAPEGDSLLFFTEEILCFDDMSAEDRCIDKAPLMEISNSPNRGLRYESFSSFFWTNRIG